MNRFEVHRPTRGESVLALLLLVFSLAEALFSDEQPPASAGRVLAAIIPPLAVSLSRAWPEAASASVIGSLLLASLSPSPQGTLGTGFAVLAVAFGLAAWADQSWPWLLALATADTTRALRATGLEASDVLIDWSFIGFVVVAGRVVRRRQLEAATVRAQLELADRDREARTASVIARERRVLARELHDIVAHSVSLMVVQAGTARPLAERTDAEIAGVLETIEDTGREALTELRRLLHVLRSEDEPDQAPQPGLADLDELIAGFRRAGMDVHADIHPPTTLPPGVALCAFRTVQEGLTNALRHAPGSRVRVEVGSLGPDVLVKVSDSGGSGTLAVRGSGTGLVGLHERVLLSGGHMTAARSGRGFVLTVTLPLTDVDTAARDESAAPRSEDHR